MLLKILAFYLEKQKSFIPKKKNIFQAIVNIKTKKRCLLTQFLATVLGRTSNFFENFPPYTRNSTSVTFRGTAQLQSYLLLNRAHSLTFECLKVKLHWAQCRYKSLFKNFPPSRNSTSVTSCGIAQLRSYLLLNRAPNVKLCISSDGGGSTQSNASAQVDVPRPIPCQDS